MTERGLENLVRVLPAAGVRPLFPPQRPGRVHGLGRVRGRGRCGRWRARRTPRGWRRCWTRSSAPSRRRSSSARVSPAAEAARRRRATLRMVWWRHYGVGLGRAPLPQRPHPRARRGRAAGLRPGPAPAAAGGAGRRRERRHPPGAVRGFGRHAAARRPRRRAPRRSARASPATTGRRAWRPWRWHGTCSSTSIPTSTWCRRTGRPSCPVPCAPPPWTRASARSCGRCGGWSPALEDGHGPSLHGCEGGHADARPSPWSPWRAGRRSSAVEPGAEGGAPGRRGAAHGRRAGGFARARRGASSSRQPRRSGARLRVHEALLAGRDSLVRRDGAARGRRHGHGRRCARDAARPRLAAEAKPEPGGAAAAGDLVRGPGPRDHGAVPGRPAGPGARGGDRLRPARLSGRPESLHRSSRT